MEILVEGLNVFSLSESAPSRDDLEESLSQKKTKKEKGFFSLFRSASDPDLKNALFCTKPKEKFPPSGGEVMGNGVHKVKKESKEKEEQEETREKKDKRKKDKKDKKGHEEEREKWEKKEKRKDKEKEKKYPRRDEKDGNESDCTICQEKRRKSREKRRSEEVKHKERRSKSEPRRERDRRDVDSDEKDFKTHVEKDDGDREHRKKKHHREKEKEKDRARRDKSHKRKTDEHGRSNERKEVVHRMGVSSDLVKRCGKGIMGTKLTFPFHASSHLALGSVLTNFISFLCFPNFTGATTRSKKVIENQRTIEFECKLQWNLCFGSLCNQ